LSSYITDLELIVGKDNVISNTTDLTVYEYDGSIDKNRPPAVVLPSDSQQVVNILKYCHRHDINVVGRGSGTGLSGGTISKNGAIQIVFTRMNKILDLDVPGCSVTVQPGVINLDLDNYVRKFGLRYPPDPSSQRSCSIGGNIAENAGGPHCLAYGTTTNYVLSIDVVLEDGSTMQLGAKSKNCYGYDLRGVFVGSEGTFGLVTAITLRLLPVPEKVGTFLGVFADVESACGAVSAIIGKGIIPAAMEMLDKLTIKAVQNVMDSGYPIDAGAVLLIEIEGMEEEVEEMSSDVSACIWESGATELKYATDIIEREALWAGRKGALGAMGSLAPNYFLVDGVVPRTKLTDVLREVQIIAEKFDIQIANVFHAGDGNLHPCLLFDERIPGALENITMAGGEVLKSCVDLGGVLSGEHGIGLEKKEYMPLVFANRDMDAMKKLRDAFAPGNKINPGKIFPDGEVITLQSHKSGPELVI
jgi:glycolate oxidase